ncbi:Tryptophan synthase beta chain like [Georgfuchsia toluolica]|uniref:Tryptophan synthase beta chain like n=1 Tax=Georgfuchsia toluolica TaxID=424218 RepID=A0A916J561_9PROT|nr:WbuC family cupin fold metalloprotein [Georgfuchsia toluolica]CAG4884886.1 Tryptophan synthase beta chain like [Georgfuchsia toluolica]
MIQIIDHKLLDEVSAEARNNLRRRKNRNFHTGDDAPANRLLNAIEPGSYIAPHRHLDPAKDETLVVLRGRFGVVLFDDAGNVAQAQVIEAGGAACGIDIPHGTWHSVLSLAPDSVFFEAKAGPYLPFASEEKASWAPAENDAGAKEYLYRLQQLFPAVTS